MKNIIKEIQTNWFNISNPNNKLILEKYFKWVVKFIWVKWPWIKSVFNIHKKNIFSLNNSEQNDIWFELIKSQYFEMKQIWIMIFEKKYKKLDENFLSIMENLISDHIYDWWSCDCLSSKVFGNMIRNNNKFSIILSKWSNHNDTWRKRASCISFVKNARFGQYNNLIINICNNCINSNERFVQLGMWWVLRELSLADKMLVMNYIKQNYIKFSREWLRYAIEKLDKDEQKGLLNYKKKLKSLKKSVFYLS